MVSNKTEYEYEGEIDIPFAYFSAWVIAQLPKGPFYAISSPVVPDENTIRLAYRASTESQPNPPLPPNL